MRKTLPVLALLATAAASRAIPTATATATTSVGFSFDPRLSYAFAATSTVAPGHDAGQYIYDYPLDGTNVPASDNPYYEYTDAAGDVAPVTDPSRHSGSLTGGSSGTRIGSDGLTLTSAVSASFMATPGDPGNQFVERRYGYRYFIEVMNGDLSATHDATFTLALQSRLVAGAVDTPYDVARNLGQYAEAECVGDVIETSAGDSGDYDLYDNTLASASGTDFSDSANFPSATRTFTVPQATLDGSGSLVPGSLELEVFSSSSIGIEDDHRPAAPVPEPSALAALGLGALGLLRRRRKA